MNKLVVSKGKSILDCGDAILDQFRKDFLDPTLGIGELAQKYNRASSTIYNWGNIELGLHRPKLKVDNRTTYRDLLASVSKMALAIPEVKVPYTPASYADNASLIAKISDAHFGRLTNSFNRDIAIKRIARLGKEIDTLAIGSQYYAKTLEVFFEGDLVLGERIGIQVNVEEIERLIMSQIFELSVPYLSQFLLDRLQSFETINVHGVRGNHGDLGKFQSKSANWDTFVYKIIEQRLINQPRIKFDIEVQNFYKYARVQDLDFLIVHGDQFKASNGIPYNNIISKTMRWQSSMPRHFDVLSFAHFHSASKFMIGNVRAYGNGTILSDDEWVREVLGLSGTTSQVALVVSGKDIILEREINLSEC
jgi:hypothetical protein